MDLVSLLYVGSFCFKSAIELNFGFNVYIRMECVNEPTLEIYNSVLQCITVTTYNSL